MKFKIWFGYAIITIVYILNGLTISFFIPLDISAILFNIAIILWITLLISGIIVIFLTLKDF